MLQPRELLRRLSERHYAGLSRRQLQLLGALELGYSTGEVAAGLSITAGTVRNELGLLAVRILEPADLPPHREVLRKWTGLHYMCCTQGSMQLLENDQLFARGNQREMRYRS